MGREVTLKQLQVEGFGPFVEPATLTLPRRGTVLLRGKNLDTGGGSGTGKTYLLNAIDMALGYASVPATELQSWFTDKPLRVQLQLGIGPDDAITISRGQKAELQLETGDKVHGKVGIDAKLQQRLGVSPKILEVLTSRKQRSQGGNFLSLGNSEKQAFLALVLDLARYETAVALSEKKSTALGLEVAAAGERVLRTRAQLEFLQQRQPQPRPREPVEALLLDQDLVQRQLAAEVVAREEACARWGELEKAKVAWRTQVDTTYRQGKGELERKLHDVELAYPDPVYSDGAVVEAKVILVQAQSFIAAAEAEYAETRRKYQQQQQQQRQRWQQLQRALGQEPALVAEIRTLTERVEKLRLHYCPTCSRVWTSAEAEALVKTYENDIAQKQEQLSQNRGFRPEVEALELALAAPPPVIDPKVESLRAVIAEQQRLLQEDRNRHQTLVNDVRAQRLQRTAALQQEQRELHSGWAALVWHREGEYKLACDAVAVADAAVAKLQERQRLNAQAIAFETKEEARFQAEAKAHAEALAGAEATLAEATAQLEPLQQQQAAELDFQVLLGREGFLGRIFDETLQDIAAETNSILETIPNTASVELGFVSERETKSGTVQKTIATTLSVGGHPAQFRSGLSGGMQAVVELAVDLALRTVVCRRLGLQPGWLILDEPFDGLGEVEKGAAMEVIDRYGQESLVLVVDHGTETKALFHRVVDIEHRGGISVIKGVI